MKHLSILVFLFFICPSLDAQVTLQIKGIRGSMPVTTAVLQSTPSTSGSSSRRSGPQSGGQYYLIQRTMDGKSAELSSAAQKGRFFKSAGLIVDLADGGRQIINLTNAYLSDYNSSLGGGSGNTESFHLVFQSQTTQTK